MSGDSGYHSCVVGLGYVGLTLALHLDRSGYETVGYDIDERKVDELRRGNDPTGEFGGETIRESGLSFATTPECIEQSEFVHVSLPTPIDESNNPDLSGLEAACETIGRHIADGAVVVFESTLYPGATREVLRPALERGAVTSGDRTFHVGYSPERFVPGGGMKFSDATKIVSAENEAVLERLAELYENVVEGDVHLAESIETAEASKCLENVQRDVNIGLVNEFAMACRHLDVDLDPYDVLEAARTKWNFVDYEPGIVGGHCIPVDPHYLRYKFEECGFVPHVLRSARSVNDQMVEYVRSITIQALCRVNPAEQLVGGGTATMTDARTEGSLPESVAGSRILLLGFGYKPNVSDLRNSGAGRIAEQFGQFELEVSGYDPFHDADSVPDSYDFEVLSRLEFDDVDATVLLTPHDEFRNLHLGAVGEAMNDNPVFVDVSNAFDPDEAASHGLAYERL